MASDLNLVALVGRVTRDAELTYTSTGTAKCNFSIAVNRSVKKGEAWTDEASFFDITLWDKRATGLQKYLVKGTQVAVKGELRQERWEKDGQKYSKVAIAVENVQLIGAPRDGQQDAPRSAAPAQRPAADDFDPHAYEDDIPF